MLLNFTNIYEFYKSIKFRNIKYHRSKVFTGTFSILICTLKAH